jgi:c-di-GMP-binding flagellar brake protein YcgR
METQNRRKYPRVSVDFVTVEVYSLDGRPQDPVLCYVINISEGGMMFRSERAYAPGQRLRLTFSLSDTNVIIKTDGTIVHTHQVSSSYLYGVQYKNLGLAEKKHIRDYVVRRTSSTD